MSYKSYLPEKFNNTHENVFFRKVNSLLNEKYANVEGLHILIGNLSVGGHQLDALFIKSGAIIVIDFKDYSGTLEFSENGPWKLTPEKGRFLFVAGGGGSRNPYQQVRAYRFSLFQFLSDQQIKILDPNHQSVSWDHTNSLVLFHRKITFNNDSIPAKIQRSFHITDQENFTNKLDDIHSDKLLFSDSEINKILEVLSINPDETYDASMFIHDETPAFTFDPDKMAKVKQLLPDNLDSPVKKAISFYSTMVSIERLNSASVTSVHHYDINWENVNFASYHLNLSQKPQFLNTFLLNQQERFPQNLFVSLNVVMNEQEIPLFYTVILSSEINNTSDIEINFNSFELFGTILSELDLPEDIIEELSNKVNSGETIQDKIQIAKEILDSKITFSNTISAGLSDESKFTLQLQSEFNNWLRNRVSLPSDGSVLHSFLTNKKINKTKIPINKDYVQITKLNTSQKEAVSSAFSQPLSVITGPPGTGKSQVVINILANALMNNQSVLFASKNNKAVNNVYLKINELLNTEYFLRLGNKEITAETIEILDKYTNRINAREFQDRQLENSETLASHRSLVDRQSYLKQQIASIPILEKTVLDFQNEESNKRKSYATWQESLSPSDKKLYLDSKFEFNINQSLINEQLHNIEKGKSFFGSIALMLGNKKKLETFVKNLNSSFPPEVQKHINNTAPYFQPGKKYLFSFENNLNFISRESQNQEQITLKNNSFNSELETLSKAILASSEELASLRKKSTAILKEIEDLEKKIISSSIEVLQLVIDDKLRTTEPYTISRYAEYISNGIPWKFDEVSDFRSVSHDFLESFKVISISNLSVKKAFLQEEALFDLLVIDEASQSDISSSLPLIYRAHRVVILGDPLQLPHITSIKDTEQDFIANELSIATTDHNYVKDSLFLKSYKVSNNNAFQSTFLNEHYRCHPQIIEFSNTHFYKAKAGQNLVVRTNPNDFKIGFPGLHWFHINGEVEQYRNVNMLEVEKCVELAEDLQNKFPEASIGIVTPFNDQKQELQKAFRNIKNDKVVVDTVNRFQGDEKDIIIFSLVVSTQGRDSLHRFINYYSAYLLNVGITRAKSALYIIGNKHYCSNLIDDKGKTLLARLAQYSDHVNQK